MDSRAQPGMNDLIFAEKAVLPEPLGPARPTWGGGRGAQWCGAGEAGVGSSWLGGIPSPVAACRQPGQRLPQPPATEQPCPPPTQHRHPAHQDGVLVVLHQQLDGAHKHEKAFVERKLALQRLDGVAGGAVRLPHLDKLQLVLEQRMAALGARQGSGRVGAGPRKAQPNAERSVGAAAGGAQEAAGGALSSRPKREPEHDRGPRSSCRGRKAAGRPAARARGRRRQAAARRTHRLPTVMLIPRHVRQQARGAYW